MTTEETERETTVKVGMSAPAPILRLVFFIAGMMFLGLAVGEFYGEGYQYLVHALGFFVIGVLINDGKTNC
jgi:hypothetical protein